MILRAIGSKVKLYIFKYKWRLKNKHNYTNAMNRFPIDVVSIGNASYGPIDIHYFENKSEKLVVGNFVSIARGVKFILGGNHNINTFSTYPFKVMVLGEHQEAWTKGPIIVEDDVWIGTDAMILSGVKIGKGAIIAAGSVVTKDVPPYALVGGNPAKVIRYRFEEHIINTLLQFDFLKLNKEKIQSNVDMMYEKLDNSKADCLIDKLNE